MSNSFDRITIKTDTEDFQILSSDMGPRTGVGKAAPRGSLCMTRQRLYHKDTTDKNGWLPVEIANG